MNQLLSIGVVFISGLSIGSGEECCPRKKVGEHIYNFVRSKDNSGYGCTSGCEYTRDGAPESLYCFKQGGLKSVCQDELGAEGSLVIDWHYGMNPFRGCAKPGSMVTFKFSNGHNVNKLTKSEYSTCNTYDHTPVSGPVEEPAPPENEHFYFACGLPTHCENGNMNAAILGSSNCAKVLEEDFEHYRKINSGLSKLHDDIQNILTTEQMNNITPLGKCSVACIPPCFCQVGYPPTCLCSDGENFPPHNLTAPIETIKKMSSSMTILQKIEYLNNSGCSSGNCEKCVENLENDIATCIEKHSPLVHAWALYDCLKAIEDKHDACQHCFCEIITHFMEKYFPYIPEWIYKCKEDKPKETNNNCTIDRDCSKFKSQKCVLDLQIEMKSDVAVDGRPRSVLTYNGQIPGPPIVLCEGDELVVNFKNRISGNMTNIDGSTNTTTLHFHGIRQKTRPWVDGVPFVTQCPILSGEDFTYGFTANELVGAPPGTYWYHSHVGSQRTNGAYGALIIKERVPDDSFVDDAANTLVLQEWYRSSTNQVPVSLLINGKGRAGEYIHSGDEDKIDDFLKGKGGLFQTVLNEYYTKDFTTNYHEFRVNTDTSYRFRIIGAISQNFPLKLSIEDHTFTAIAVDSLDIQPVEGLTAVWLAAGERYDIVVTSIPRARVGEAYKIRVSGYSHPNNRTGPLCTIAWLKYPGQFINQSYICNPDESLPPPPIPRTLNPVPNNFAAWDSRLKFPDWNDTTKAGDIFIVDLRATEAQPTINFLNLSNLNTQYIAFEGEIAFNGKRMTYPDVPFLLQDPANISERCGSDCKFHLGRDQKPEYQHCTEYPKCKEGEVTVRGSDCECQHVIKEPWFPGYWAEFVLINNNNGSAAHPIHQHGGWYWVVGMGKYDKSQTVNRTFIMDQDNKGLLNRTFDYPPAKDTIQVPQKGYIIIRMKLDNAGTWIFHCHINHHVEIGMAMVLQIGGLGETKSYLQEWCTGPLERNAACETKPFSPYGSSTSINWFYGMEPDTHRCVAPGMTVTFIWQSGHNVNQLPTEIDYRTCNLQGGYHGDANGDYVWTAPNTTVAKDYYFACGRDYNSTTQIGGHCKYGNMKAMITVSNKCNV